MFRHISRKVLAIILLCITCQSWALHSDKSKPAHISADTVKYNGRSHLNTYIGHVKFDQGTTHVTAKLVFIYISTNHKVDKIIAIGNPAYYSTLPDGQHNKLIATAKTIEYIPSEQRAFLIGNAKLLNNNNTMIGSKIQYNLRDKFVITTPSKNQKTQIVLRSISEKNK